MNPNNPLFTKNWNRRRPGISDEAIDMNAAQQQIEEDRKDEAFRNANPDPLHESLRKNVSLLEGSFFDTIRKLAGIFIIGLGCYEFITPSVQAEGGTAIPWYLICLVGFALAFTRLALKGLAIALIGLAFYQFYYAGLTEQGFSFKEINSSLLWPCFMLPIVSFLIWQYATHRPPK